LSIGPAGVGPRQVQLDAIAGAEDRRLAPVAGFQLVHPRNELRSVERQLLAQLDRRGLIATPGEQEVHGGPSCKKWCGEEISMQTSTAKATMVSHATCRPRM